MHKKAKKLVYIACISILMIISWEVGKLFF